MVSCFKKRLWKTRGVIMITWQKSPTPIKITVITNWLEEITKIERDHKDCKYYKRLQNRCKTDYVTDKPLKKAFISILSSEIRLDLNCNLYWHSMPSPDETFHPISLQMMRPYCRLEPSSSLKSKSGASSIQKLEEQPQAPYYETFEGPVRFKFAIHLILTSDSQSSSLFNRVNITIS